ncbi:MAG: hypothetical protein HYZ00_07350 [Candidatus Hydrogenedentes bacterium]|nr:hypothetical protein [Candidatus Hydrogenedentota bacterium]
MHALSLEVAGRARDDYYVARVEVGGQQVAVLQSAPELPFRVTVPIGPGTREVPVIVTDLAGHVATASLPLETDLDGPAVSLDAPADDGTRAGVVFDPAGIKRLAVNGQDIPLSPVDETTATFTLPGEMVNASTAFVCEDQLDNRTVGKFDQDPAAILSGTSAATSWAVAPPLTRWLTYWTQVFFGAQPEPVSPLRISFEQMEEGQEFYAEEILVTLRVSSDAPLAALSLNDIALPLPAGRHSVLLSRRFALLPGQNTFAASARDAQDRTASEARNIMRAETQIEATAGRLNVAFLGNILPAPDPDTTALADTVFDTLPSFPRIQNRFSIVDRALLTPILAEQQLAAALASAESRLALGRLIPAEVMFAGRVRQDAESIEIVLDGASTETGARLTGRVEVAGAPANLESLLDDLSLRLVQEFPRVKGLVIQRDARGFLTDLGRKQGLKNSYKCLVYRTEKVTHPVTGQSLGERPLQIYQGVIQSVDEGFSSGALLPLQDSDDVAAYDVQVNDYVLTK